MSSSSAEPAPLAAACAEGVGTARPGRLTSGRHGGWPRHNHCVVATILVLRHGRQGPANHLRRPEVTPLHLAHHTQFPRRHSLCLADLCRAAPAIMRFASLTIGGAVRHALAARDTLETSAFWHHAQRQTPAGPSLTGKCSFRLRAPCPLGRRRLSLSGVASGGTSSWKVRGPREPTQVAAAFTQSSGLAYCSSASASLGCVPRAS